MLGLQASAERTVVMEVSREAREHRGRIRRRADLAGKQASRPRTAMRRSSSRSAGAKSSRSSRPARRRRARSAPPASFAGRCGWRTSASSPSRSTRGPAARSSRTSPPSCTDAGRSRAPWGCRPSAGRITWRPTDGRRHHDPRRPDGPPRHADRGMRQAARLSQRERDAGPGRGRRGDRHRERGGRHRQARRHGRGDHDTRGRLGRRGHADRAHRRADGREEDQARPGHRRRRPGRMVSRADIVRALAARA